MLVQDTYACSSIQLVKVIVVLMAVIVRCVLHLYHYL